MSSDRRPGYVLLLSGGMDSCALLADLVDANGPSTVTALTVDYGQRNHVELQAAREMCRHYGVEQIVVQIQTALERVLAGNTSSLVNDAVPVPHAHYNDPAMLATVIPNRNMILLSLAAAAAISRGYGSVAYAAHDCNPEVYPDCTPPFADALAQAMLHCDPKGITLFRPYIGLTKAQVVSRGTELGAPFHLSYSCYEGWDKHCGRCGTCIERREAFELAGVVDPTEYAAA